MPYLEQIGVTCANCGNQGKGKCNVKCIENDSRPGWEPAPGVLVKIYEVWHGKRRGKGREVIKEAI